MSISSMMNASVSGMAGQANRLASASDNIANLDTVGYKRAKVDFSTLVLSSSEQKYAAGGVVSSASNVISEQGTLKGTTSQTDLAISGDGFFVVRDSKGASYLTRAGSFVPDVNGYLVNSAGYQLLGYAGASDASAPVNSAAGLSPVRLAASQMQASPTTEAQLVVNLPADAAATPGADLPSANAATAAFEGKTSLVVFDNLGRTTTLDVYSTKVSAENWEVTVYDRADADPVTNSFPYGGSALASVVLQFDPTTGRLDASSASSLDVPVPNGATIAMDFTGTSQLAADYSVLKANADGAGASLPSGAEISSDGTFYTVFEDGSRLANFQIPLARVASPDRLEVVNGNAFAPTQDSGAMQIGRAAGEGFGQIISGALESSTVEVADELIGLIQAERNYTANSKVFQTSSELMEVLINLKR